MQIIEVRLKTNDLETQKAFYRDVMRFPLLEASPDSVTFQVGASRLVFEREAGWHDIYHFAFDVPENQLDEAKRWIEARVPIQIEGEGEIVYFQSWNAHALYFFDPAENVLEFIARHNQPNASDQPFSEQSIISISEIGLAAENLREMVTAIDAALDIGIYAGAGGEEFTAMGDELGLFITVKRGRGWFASREKPAELCPTSVIIAGKSTKSFEMAGLPYQIQMVSKGAAEG